jgi:hypothetical protein
LNYSFLDRLVHKLAFGLPLIQRTAEDIESATLGAVYDGATAAQPIFITSLPRAGTTMFLEILHRWPHLATHLYRDMPFVMAPVIWSRVSGIFHKRSELRERAHRDGLQVGYDSPEAFEEIIWNTLWPEKYGETRIELWEENDSKADASEFFLRHMKKIIAIRCPDRILEGRYISKNNANIARLDLIPCMFPDASILVPVRHPFEHAASLLRQHENFRELHQKDSFSRRYMADLGHYEFGELHKPIAFPGLDALISNLDTLTIDYWLAYWIAAFDYIYARRDSVIVVSYEDICRDGERGLRKVLKRLGIDNGGVLQSAAQILRAPSQLRYTDFEINPDLGKRAEVLYESLLSH